MDPSLGARTEAFAVNRGANQELGPNAHLHRGTTVLDLVAGPRARFPDRDRPQAQAQHGPKPSTVMPSVCLSTCLMLRRHLLKTRW